MTTPQSPLDLTITNLPKPEVRTAIGRWKMFLVMAVCAAPVIASYTAYYVIKPSESKLLKTKSFGELVQPQRPLPTALSKLRGQWLLVSVSGAACAEPCPSHLYMQRQLRETLGREKDRLDWVWLISDDAPIDTTLASRLDDPALKGFIKMRASKDDLAAWFGVEALPTIEERLYLIDPQGNYMLRFPAKMTMESASKAKSDINRLLRASIFWDTPGRDNIKPAVPSKP